MTRYALALALLAAACGSPGPAPGHDAGVPPGDGGGPALGLERHGEPCDTDADCAGGQCYACFGVFCDDTPRQCAAHCWTAADCPAGFACPGSPYDQGGDPLGVCVPPR